MAPIKRDISQTPVWCEVLRTIARIFVSMCVCLHGKTWLLSLKLLLSSTTLIGIPNHFHHVIKFWPLITSSLSNTSILRFNVMKSSIVVGGQDTFWETARPSPPRERLAVASSDLTRSARRRGCFSQKERWALVCWGLSRRRDNAISLVCLNILATGSTRDFGKNHNEDIIDIKSYEGETYGVNGEPQRTLEDPRGRWLSSKSKVISRRLN